MGEQPQCMDVFLDLLPNLPKNDQSRESVRQASGSSLRAFCRML
jgi:hypothetical protein